MAVLFAQIAVRGSIRESSTHTHTHRISLAAVGTRRRVLCLLAPGTAHSILGKGEIALDDLPRILRLDCDQALGRFLLADIVAVSPDQTKSGKYKSAIALLETAREVHSKVPLAVAILWRVHIVSVEFGIGLNNGT
ncbi:MAG: hypothetical protein ACI915_005072 [Gammaproteobacteria bacterium]|jgi:hypothetical protein